MSLNKKTKKLLGISMLVIVVFAAILVRHALKVKIPRRVIFILFLSLKMKLLFLIQ